ncbi:MAG TPA: peptidoglycan recognition family protein [Drouetiella sp.]
MRNSFVEQSVSQQRRFGQAQVMNVVAALLAIAAAQTPAEARSHVKKAAPAPAHHSAAATSSRDSHHSASGVHHAVTVSSHHSGAASVHHGSHISSTTATSRHGHGAAAVASSRHHSEEPTTHLVAHVKRGKHGRKIVVYERVKDTQVATHQGRHQQAEIVTHEIVHVVKTPPAPKTRYAYPLSFFMMHPPEFERSALPNEVSDKISRSFHNGYADSYAARSLVRAGLVSYHPLRGGIFWRREPVKYIIMHSTETGIPLSAERVIESWSSSGLRHAGAQYVVERDGTIFQAVDPDLGTVHINIFKTLPGINNDNSIGIEMCHTGRQDYPPAQLQSVVKLVAYLQERYKVSDDNVITHRYAQQGDHTDPVNFDWDGFIASKNNFRNRAIAYKVRKLKDDVKDWSDTTTTTTVTTTTVAPTTIVPSTVVTTPVVPTVVPTTSTTTVVPTVVKPGSATTSQVKEYTYSKTPDVSVPEASTYLQPHRLMPVIPVYKTTTTTTSVTTTPNAVPEPKMILIPPKSEPGDTPAVAPMVLPKNMPSLRGPIEMAPQAAPGLNSVPVPGN